MFDGINISWFARFYMLSGRERGGWEREREISNHNLGNIIWSDGLYKSCLKIPCIFLFFFFTQMEELEKIKSNHLDFMKEQAEVQRKRKRILEDACANVVPEDEIPK